MNKERSIIYRGSYSKLKGHVFFSLIMMAILPFLLYSLKVMSEEILKFSFIGLFIVFIIFLFSIFIFEAEIGIYKIFRCAYVKFILSEEGFLVEDEINFTKKKYLWKEIKEIEVKKAFPLSLNLASVFVSFKTLNKNRTTVYFDSLKKKEIDILSFIFEKAEENKIKIILKGRLEKVKKR